MRALNQSAEKMKHTRSRTKHHDIRSPKQKQHTHTPQHVINGASRIGFEKKTMNDDNQRKQ